MSGPKIIFIGAGSTIFAKKLIGDLVDELIVARGDYLPEALR